MGTVKIVVEVLDEKASTKINASSPNVSDLSVALAQLELMKFNLIAKIAKHTRIKDPEDKKDRKVYK